MKYEAGQLMPLDPDWEEVAGEFVYIPAGEFIMGSENGFDNEKPLHKVIMSKSFEMGKYQITQKQWETVIGNNPSRAFKGEKLPVQMVSWNSVQKFISELNTKSSTYIYNLPTEAQWEYACRAGELDDYLQNLDEIAWHEGNSDLKIHPVGQKKPNAWGLYDILGNVWEWCLDWDGSYSSETVTDPVGASSGLYRVFRGGGFYLSATYFRFSFRMAGWPSDFSSYLGFRLTRIVR